MSEVTEKPSFSLTREIPFGSFREAKLPYANNAVTTRKFTGSSLLSHVLVFAVMGGGYAWSLAAAVIEGILISGNWFSGPADIVIFAVAMFLVLAGEIFQEYQRIAADRRTNSVSCRFWNGSAFVDCPSGDFLLVSNGEALAADVVLFTTEHPDGFCYVDTSQTIGSAEMTKKHAVPDVQRFVESSSVDRLANVLGKVKGLIRTSQPNQDFQAFVGQLRLARSPAAVPLTMNNFVLRGSCVFGSAWVLGCVVAAGMETKVMLNSKSTIRSRSRLESTLYVYFLFAMSLSGLLIIGNFTGFLLVSDLGDSNSLTWVVLLSFVYIHRLVPAMLLLVLIAAKLLQTLVVNRTNSEVHLNPFSLPASYGQLDYIVADKNCAFTCDNPKVHTIIYRDKMFGQCSGYDEGTHSCVGLMRRQKNKAVVIADIFALCSEKRPSGDPNEHTFASVKSQRELAVEDVEESCGFRSLEAQLAGESEDVIRLFECMVLCNTITQLDPLKAKNKFEQSLILCGDRFGFKLLEAGADRTVLDINGRRIAFNILASTDYSKSTKRMRVLTDRSDDSSGALYVKGSIEVLGPLLSIDEELFDHIRATALEVKKAGLVPIMLACKYIREDDLEVIKDRISKAQSSILNVKSKIESLLSELERELQYLGIACVEDTISDDTVDGVRKLAKAGVKLWMVSNDSETETLATCLRTDFFDEDGYIVPVKEISDNRSCGRLLSNLITEFVYHKPLLEATSDMPSAISNAKSLRHSSIERLWSAMAGTEATARKENHSAVVSRPFDPSGLNYMVIMDGISFETALMDEETQRLLAALLFASRVVCLFSMLPHQKAKVVRFLKHSFSFHPAILTFADGLSCTPMLNESDLTVGLQRYAHSSVLVDAKVKSLNDLADFVVSDGRNWYKRLKNAVEIVLFENTMVVTVFVVYSGFCGFTSNSPIDLPSMWMFTMVFTVPLILYLSLFSRDAPSDHSLNHPEIYRWRNPAITLLSIAKILFLALIESALAFGFLLIDYGEMRNSQGFTENYTAMSSATMILLFCITIGHAVATIDDRSRGFALSIFSCFICFLASILLSNFFNSEESYYISIAFSYPQLILKIVLTPLFTTSISFSVSTYAFLFGERLSSFLNRQTSESALLSRFSQNLSLVWTPSKVWAPPKSGDIFERKPVLGTYKIQSLENNYQVSIFPELIRHIQTNFIVLALIACSCTVHSIVTESAARFYSLRILFSCFCVFLFTFSFSKAYKNHYVKVNLCSLALLSFVLALYEVLSENSSSEIAIAVPILSFLSFYVTIAQVALISLANLFSFFLIGIFNILLPACNSTDGVLFLTIKTLDVCGVALTASIAGYFMDSINRKKFELLTAQENELEKADNVLKYLLPEFVRARVKDGVRFIAEVQPCVHILFCEICDFDHIIRDYQPVEVISLLNSVYEKFDELCDSCGVTKVETVGKVYMACVGVKESEQDLKTQFPKLSEAHRLLYFAFEIISVTEQFRLADGAPIRIKIGMHSGKVIAGVVGYHKPQFSLVGDTVNTASRMCSTLEQENMVQMSETTYLLLKDTYGVQFESCQKAVKGKGTMDVYTAWRYSDNFQANLIVHEVTPELQRASSTKRPSNFARGMTVARRDSVFEANADVLRNFQKKGHTHKQFWKMFQFRIESEKYYQEILALRRPVAVLGLTAVLVFNLLGFALETVDFAIREGDWQAIITRSINCTLLSVLVFLSKSLFTARRFSWVATGLLGAIVLTYFLEIFCVGDAEDVSNNLTMVVMTVLAAVHFTGMRSYQLLPFIAVTGGLSIGVFQKFSQLFEEELRLACVLGELFVFFLFVLYRDVRLEKYFELKEAVTAEIEKTEKLLENLLPQHILDSMKLEKAITDHLEDTTLLVADIVGFTAWSNDREPAEVIEMLSEMFTEFDKLCLTYKTYKVYTIGDCYIAMGFSGKHDYRDPRQECLNVVSMAVEMKKVIERVNDDYFTSLNMRIGIHTGEIIGGVVGTNIVRYDIYGQDVLIAFKMESNSKPGLINVSESTKRFLEEAAPGSFRFQQNCVVDISAIGAKVACYFTALEEN